MSIAFDSLDWKPLTLSPTNRPGASSKNEPIMAAQIDDTTQVEIWGNYNGTLSMILGRQGQMPLMVTDTGYSAAHHELDRIIDMQTWPAEFNGQQVIPRDEPWSDFERELLNGWRCKLPYLGAHQLTISAEEIKAVVLPRFTGMQQMSWEHFQFNSGSWDGEASWTPTGDRHYFTVEMLLNVEKMRGHRVDAPQAGPSTEFIYSRTSPERVQHIMDTAAPQPVADTSPQSTTSPSLLQSVAASLKPPNAHTINSASPATASAVTATSPRTHQQGTSRTR